MCGMERTKFKRVLDNKPLVDDSFSLENKAFVEKITNPYFEKKQLSGILVKSRPFKNDFIRQVYYLAKGGFKEDQIAEFFGVSVSTITEWKKDPDFLEALMEGKWIPDFQVVESLEARANGYTYEEEEIAEHCTKSGEIVQLTKRTKKHVPPDITAQIFWLKNRQKEIWGNVDRTEIFAETLKMDLSVLTPDEQKMIKSITMKKISTVHGNTR